MGVRVVNGNTFTEDGWPLVDQDGCTWIAVPGTSVSLQIQSGVPARVLGAWVADWNAYVEPVYDADSASWTEGNSVLGEFGENNGSNHLGGTAVDVRWQSHPWKVRNGGLNAAQLATIDEMLDWYEGCIWWGGNWPDAYVDPMHSQLGSLSSGSVATYDNGPTPHISDFIARKIRPDGFSTFRRGAMPATPPAARVLSDATGLSLDRATEILPTVVSGLQAAECNNVNRVAMWLAQCGEESAGFSTTEEFASGAEYEGRCSDLGNCSPGDGVKYKGRTWIQITGKAHYSEFSEWAFGKGLCGSPTQFVDNPTSLGDLQWAGIGAAWYWTVSRPDINALSDAGDVVTVTHRINGGENGLADRQNRYGRAHGLGDQLLALTTAQPTTPGDDMALVPQQEWDDFKRQWADFVSAQPTLSPFRPPGAPVFAGPAQFIRWSNGGSDFQDKKDLAVLGHQPTIDLLNQIAVLTDPDRQADAALARNVLAAAKRAWATPTAPTTGAAAPTAPVVDNSGELADARLQLIQLRAENTSLRDENTTLRAQVAQKPVAADQQPVSTELAAVGSTGDVAKTVIDAVEGWTDKALGLDTKQRAALTASMTVLQLNGNQQ